MSDDEVDQELLVLLRKSLGIANGSVSQPPETKVLEGAEYVYDNAIDVALDPQGTKAAASTIWALMQSKGYSTKAWSSHELHPQTRDAAAVDFIFTMDLLNFCFWSEGTSDGRFSVNYRGKTWTGYWSLVAALHRALDEEIPITSSDFWQDRGECTDEVLRYVFRSATKEQIPLLEKRMACLREAGQILYERFQCSFTTCIREAKGSAAALVNLIVENFPCFRDEVKFEGKKVRLYKRAQILVADLWACFEGESYGRFDDIGKITAFADYRIPQMLHSLHCFHYSPPLDHHIRQLRPIESGHSWEVQLRGCSVWCIELIRREIVRRNPGVAVNAILIDFFLYDTMKQLEAEGLEAIPHHRTRSIWY
ncbi:Protein of unknown function DUF2419 [Lasallia pustulata]|uniref:Queuosine 5'-phosphate N-glycosylase/hydrolase n=1 Tax=Lasallia pustulata TaxID=136370 RepID=A0A1W5D067_9LECA|nr:Protein of unknown function DUF2419 [Lasallia pustulata]